MRKTLALFATAAAALTTAIAIFLAPNFTQSTAARDAQKITASTQIAGGSMLEATRIVPADVLGTGVVHWAPLTGDGSN
jgi:hypothetical protein